MKRLLVVTLTVLALFTTTVSADVVYKSKDVKEKSKAGNVTYAYGVTEEMCKADYWAAKTKTDANEVLMNAEEIDAVNANALNTKGTYMNDLVGLPLTYNAFEIRDSLAHNSEVPSDPCYSVCSHHSCEKRNRYSRNCNYETVYKVKSHASCVESCGVIAP